jgi:hypothetical protein
MIKITKKIVAYEVVDLEASQPDINPEMSEPMEEKASEKVGLKKSAEATYKPR